MAGRTIQPPVTMSIETTQEVYRALGTLQATGLFGSTAEEVAERLICEKIQELAQRGWTGKRRG